MARRIYKRENIDLLDFAWWQKKEAAGKPPLVELNVDKPIPTTCGCDQLVDSDYNPHGHMLRKRPELTRIPTSRATRFPSRRDLRRKEMRECWEHYMGPAPLETPRRVPDYLRAAPMVTAVWDPDPLILVEPTPEQPSAVCHSFENECRSILRKQVDRSHLTWHQRCRVHQATGYPTLTEEFRDLMKLLQSPHKAFLDDPGEPGRTKGVRYERPERTVKREIIPPLDELPPWEKRELIPRIELRRWQGVLNPLMAGGQIRLCRSLWAVPAQLSLDHEGEWELEMDFSHLEPVGSNRPTPEVDQVWGPPRTLDRLLAARWFSWLHIAGGPQQIALSKEYLNMCAFSTPHGDWTWQVTPRSLRGARKLFRGMLYSQVLHGWGEWTTIVDDSIVIFSNTQKKHLLLLSSILYRMREIGIKLCVEHSGFCRVGWLSLRDDLSALE